jgi:hypothetical protein
MPFYEFIRAIVKLGSTEQKIMATTIHLQSVNVKEFLSKPLAEVSRILANIKDTLSAHNEAKTLPGTYSPCPSIRPSLSKPPVRPPHRVLLQLPRVDLHLAEALFISAS